MSLTMIVRNHINVVHAPTDYDLKRNLILFYLRAKLAGQSPITKGAGMRNSNRTQEQDILFVFKRIIIYYYMS